MTLQTLTAAEIKELEAKLDHAFESSRLPGTDYYRAAWAILTAGENEARTMVDATKTRARSPRGTDPPAVINQRVSFFFDNYKYALKQALKLCAAKLPVGAEAQSFEWDHANNSLAKDLLFERAKDYADINRKFLALHNHLYKCAKEDDGYITFPEPEDRLPYSALEILCWDKRERERARPAARAPIDFMIDILNHEKMWNTTVEEIVKRAKVIDKRLEYPFLRNLARRLQGQFELDMVPVPADWLFPWGTVAETELAYRALVARCCYHIATVHFLDKQAKLARQGLNHVCLVTDRSVLIQDLVRISGLTTEKVSTFLSALTCGSGVDSPDPALQPLVPLGSATLAVPGFLMFSSNHARNFLSLHIRLDQKHFDENSHVFEQQMTKEICAAIGHRFSIVKENFYAPDGGEGAQIDVVLGEHKSRTLIFLELRWMLNPGDPREVINRISECRRKVRQHAPKITKARALLPKLLTKLGLNASESWQVFGLVVIEGFGGTPTIPESGVPIVPREVFLSVLKHMKDVRHLYPFFMDRRWLPENGKDFVLRAEKQEVFGIPMKKESFGAGQRAYFTEAIPDALKAFEEAAASPS